METPYTVTCACRALLVLLTLLLGCTEVPPGNDDDVTDDDDVADDDDDNAAVKLSKLWMLLSACLLVAGLPANLSPIPAPRALR